MVDEPEQGQASCGVGPQVNFGIKRGGMDHRGQPRPAVSGGGEMLGLQERAGTGPADPVFSRHAAEVAEFNDVCPDRAQSCRELSQHFGWPAEVNLEAAVPERDVHEGAQGRGRS